MVFSSAIFLLAFLPIVFSLNFFIKKGFSNVLLLIASLIFYAWGEPYLVLLMMFSILFNWTIGKAIGAKNKEQGIGNNDQKQKNKERKTENSDQKPKIKEQKNRRTEEQKEKILLLIVGIVCNLSLLGYYKYAGFLVSILNDVAGKELLPVPEIALPIGISFFTFQAISYIVDVYRGDVEHSGKLINVALYISFFPQLIAGPIVKYRDINKQIEERTVTWTAVSAGFKRFIYGLAKKVLISNVLGLCVDTVYSYDISAIDTKAAWIAALAYTFQIYYDFSGYSDMALGLGKMFGFDIPENFHYPYLSKSISEFWRRWHISLGSWFREYVYIPLGGSRKGKTRTYVNLAIVFFLTGLWHGADFSFILWGMYHGLFCIIERLGFKNCLEKSKILSVVYSFLVVNFGWVLFRAGDIAVGFSMLARMLNPWKYGMGSNGGIGNIGVTGESKLKGIIEQASYVTPKTMFIFACAVLGAGLLKQVVPAKIADRWRDSALEAFYCVALLTLCLASIASDTYNPFIYFQF